jgi:hypothetical protein
MATSIVSWLDRNDEHARLAAARARPATRPGLISWLDVRDPRRHPLDLLDCVIGSVAVFVAAAGGWLE